MLGMKLVWLNLYPIEMKCAQCIEHYQKQHHYVRSCTNPLCQNYK